MNKTRTIHHLTIFALVSIIMATIYMVAQQVYPIHVNDTQVQLADNLKAHLEQNKPIDYLLDPDRIDLTKNLQALVAFFESTGKPIQTAAYLNNEMPLLTKRTSDFVKRKKEDRITWYREYEWPSIILPVDHSSIKFLLVGRSVKGIEESESKLSSTVLIAWIVCVLAILFSGLIISVTEKTNKEI